MEDLNGAVGYRTVERWCKMIRGETDTIDLSKPSGRYRAVRTKALIQKIKRKLKDGKKISWRKLALEMDMSFSSAYRVLKKDLKMKPYKNCYSKMSIKLSGKNSPIGREKSSGQRIQCEPFFPMKNCLILTASIKVKIIVYGPLIQRKQIGEVEKNSEESLQKK